jgi:hypothetical protein
VNYLQPTKARGFKVDSRNFFSFSWFRMVTEDTYGTRQQTLHRVVRRPKRGVTTYILRPLIPTRTRPATG